MERIKINLEHGNQKQFLQLKDLTASDMRNMSEYARRIFIDLRDFSYLCYEHKEGDIQQTFDNVKKNLEKMQEVYEIMRVKISL